MVVSDRFLNWFSLPASPHRRRADWTQSNLGPNLLIDGRVNWIDRFGLRAGGATLIDRVDIGRGRPIWEFDHYETPRHILFWRPGRGSLNLRRDELPSD